MTQASPLSRLEKLADANYGPIPKEEFFGGDFSQHEAFMAGGKAFLQILSEPGEACGPRLMIQSSPLSADKEEYVPLTELLQARAAHELELADIQRDGEQMIAQISTAMQKVVIERDAERAALASSEARVRILTEAVEFYKALEEPFGNGTMAKIRTVYGRPTPAERALLEVQR